MSFFTENSNKYIVAAYDEPILKNTAAKNQGLLVLPDMITIDNYGFAVQIDNIELKNKIDEVITELENNGAYDEMLKRWLPKEGTPAPMPDIELTVNKGVLRFGTAAITEPFSFVDDRQKIVGFDIELDMIGACITITEERAKNVLFSKPYYKGGIAALVRE